MDSEHRANRRFAIQGGLPGEVSILAPIEIRDFCEGGAKIDSAFPLVVDSIHDIRLELSGVAIIVKGRVAHCAIADLGGDLVRYRAGVEFVSMPSYVTTAIKAYLDEIAERRKEEPTSDSVAGSISL
jgi:hypothetical protein